MLGEHDVAAGAGNVSLATSHMWNANNIHIFLINY